MNGAGRIRVRMNYGPKQANVLIHFQATAPLDKLIICRSGCTIFAFEFPGHIFRIPRSRCFVVFSVSTHLPRVHTHTLAHFGCSCRPRGCYCFRDRRCSVGICAFSRSAFCGRRSIGAAEANERQTRRTHRKWLWHFYLRAIPFSLMSWPITIKNP